MSLRWAIGGMKGLVRCERALGFGMSAVLVLAFESVFAVDYTMPPDIGSWERTRPSRDPTVYNERWTRDSEPWARESVPHQPDVQPGRRDANNGVPYSRYPEQRRAWTGSVEGYQAGDRRASDRPLPRGNEGYWEPNDRYRPRERSLEQPIVPRQAPALEYAEPREDAWWAEPQESAWRPSDAVTPYRANPYDDGYWQTPDDPNGSWGREFQEGRQGDRSEEVWGRNYSPEWNPEPAPYYHDLWAEPDTWHGAVQEERPWARRRPQQHHRDEERAHSMPAQPRQQWSEDAYSSPNPLGGGYAPSPYGGYPPTWGLPGWGAPPGLSAWDGLLWAGGWPWFF